VRRCTGCVVGLSLLVVWLGCGGSKGGIEPRFVAIRNALTTMGMAQMGSVHQGQLQQGGEGRTRVELKSGRCYTFVALGSAQVDNLDVLVLDQAGNEIGRDTTLDRQAAAQACPKRSGEHQVVVRMKAGRGEYLLSTWAGTARGAANAPTAAEGDGAGTCDSPLELDIGRPVQGDTSRGESRMQGECIRGHAPEQVYRIEIEARSQLSATLQSEFDGALYLLRSCGDMESVVGCNDDAGKGETARSQLEIAAVDPGTYYLVVDGYGSQSGEYELIVSMSKLRSIEAVCRDAQSLLPRRPATGSTEGAPDYFHATCAGSASSPDRVYRIDVSRRSRLRVRSQTDYDGALYLRAQCDDPSSELVCNDDAASGDQRHSMVKALVDPGEYYVYADGYSGHNQTQAGTFTLSADLEPDVGSGIRGDSCGDARKLPKGPVELDMFAARDDLQGTCGGDGAADAVYRLEVDRRSRLRVDLKESEFDGVMYLQRRCGEPSSELSCVEFPSSASSGPRRRRNARAPRGGTLEAVLQPGAYSLVLDGQREDAFGRVRTEVQVDDLVALERACQSAPLLQPGSTVEGTTLGKGDDFQASCAGRTQSPDAVYRLQLKRRSKVTVRMSSQFDGALHVRRDCLDAGSEVACNDDHENNRNSRVSKTLDRGMYYVIVDGFRTGNAGDFSLEAEVEPQ
jgi:hypothetical protein